MKKQSVIYVESFALHVHFICAGQHKVQKTHSVIRALVFLVFLVQLHLFPVQILMFLDGSLHKTLIIDTVSDENLELRNLQNLVKVKQYIPAVLDKYSYFPSVPLIGNCFGHFPCVVGTLFITIYNYITIYIYISLACTLI